MKSNIPKDKYRWLETDSIRTRSWIKKESELTRAYFKNKNLFFEKELNKLYRVDEEFLPSIRGNKFFFRYRKAEEELPSLYVKNGEKGKPKLLIGSKEQSKIGVIQGWSVSKGKGKYVLIRFSKAGNDKGSLHVFDVKNRKFLKDVIPEKRYPYIDCWDEEEGFWYVRGVSDKKGEEKYFKKIFYHKIGTDVSKDRIFFDKDLVKDDWPTANVSDGGEHLVINVQHADESTTSYLCFRDDPQKGFIKIKESEKGKSYVVVQDGFLYLSTDYKAPNDKILKAKIDGKGVFKWKTIVPERKFNLENWRCSKGYLFLNYQENVSSKLYVLDLKTYKRKEVKLPGIGSVHSMSGEFDSNELYFSFSSFNFPPTIFCLKLPSLKTKIYSQMKISEDLSQIKVVQMWSKSKDGTRVPMFIVSKKGIKLNGNNPTLVYAYGGFGVSLHPVFSPWVIPFINSGGIFVRTSIRGGGEFGEKWHDPYRENKRHKIFEDFASVLKYLDKKRFSNPSKIAIKGGSNGGLLMSVMMQKYPKLFKAAIISVPVTDMLRFHLFHGGRWWIREYGDPENERMKKYLLTYSPYHNVKNNFNYPSALVMTSDQDDRVHPMHSYKLVARLRENKKQTNPILLRVEKNAGHSGASQVNSTINEFVDEYNFIFKELNILKEGENFKIRL